MCFARDIVLVMTILSDGGAGSRGNRADGRPRMIYFAKSSWCTHTYTRTHALPEVTASTTTRSILRDLSTRRRDDPRSRSAFLLRVGRDKTQLSRVPYTSACRAFFRNRTGFQAFFPGQPPEEETEGIPVTGNQRRRCLGKKTARFYDPNIVNDCKRSSSRKKRYLPIERKLS